MFHLKLQEYKSSKEQRRRTSQSIDNFVPQSVHRLSLQKLRLAKPLAEAKSELDEALYAIECQNSRVKLGVEMIRRLKNGKEVLSRVNRHSHYRLEVSVAYSDEALFKKVDHDFSAIEKLQPVDWHADSRTLVKLYSCKCGNLNIINLEQVQQLFILMIFNCN